MNIKYILTEENIEEIRNAMGKKENVKFYKKLLSVVLRGEGKKNKEIAEITKYHGKRISHTISKLKYRFKIQCPLRYASDIDF